MTKLTNVLQTHLQKNSTRPFVRDIYLNQWFTGQDIEADITTLQGYFQQMGLGNGDVILMSLRNSSAYLPINQAMWRWGITAHPVAANSANKELAADYQEHQYPAVILTADKVTDLQKFPELSFELVKLRTFPEGLLIGYQTHRQTNPNHQPTEDSLGWILNTSGTTGKPKQVGLTHQMMWQAAIYDAESHQLSAQDTVLIVMPMFHINAQELIIVSTLFSDGRIVIAPKFSASSYWDWISDYDCTWSSVVPTIVTILLKNQESQKRFNPRHHLRFIRCASAMLPVERHQEFIERFQVPILEGYGLTEACSQCTLNPLDQIRVGSVGKPYGTQVQIFAEGTYTTTANVTGEIVIKGNHVITEYLNADAKAQRDFHDGWFHTGDLGYFDHDGYLWLNGRRKNIINHGGEKINPTMVEGTLGSLDFIKDVAVVGTPDQIYGENVAAAIILQAGVDGSADLKNYILSYAEKKLAKYRRPTEIYFIDQFPLNPTGKVIRPQLVKQLTDLKMAE
ncbi:AMP-binding protein [Limosilactobacillus caecicola]|uniref:AMP-binding protein n=1 Tax=Limosilactobacillus caecicola TaxID=2941332 RepID=UPI00203BE25D|nr:AMP-binding protein [Limosilactobacillus caecicola]